MPISPPSRTFWGIPILPRLKRYCRVSNVKAQRDYYTAIELVMQRSQRGKDEESSSMMSRKKTPGRRPDQREIRVLVPTRKDETPEQGKNAGYTAGERRETSVPQFPADVKHEPGDGVSEEAMRNDEFRYRRYPGEAIMRHQCP